MSDMEETDYLKSVRDVQKWDECGKRLNEIAAEFKQRIGDAPIYVDGSGKFHVHPEFLAEIRRPENEGLYEFFLYMQRISVEESDSE